MAQKDGILYIAGGWMQYSSGYTGYNGPSSYLLRMHSPPSKLTIDKMSRYGASVIEFIKEFPNFSR